MADRVTNVLFLCTGNSARSIMAEAILNREGRGRFRAHGAGSRPAGAVNSRALEPLRARGHPTEGLASKGWEVFAQEGAPRMDLVVTVCDNAAGEACRVWPGRPASGHWPIPDPAARDGPEARAVFARVCDALEARVRAPVVLPPAELAGPGLRERIAAPGAARPEKEATR